MCIYMYIYIFVGSEFHTVRPSYCLMSESIRAAFITEIFFLQLFCNKMRIIMNVKEMIHIFWNKVCESFARFQLKSFIRWANALMAGIDVKQRRRVAFMGLIFSGWIIEHPIEMAPWQTFNRGGTCMYVYTYIERDTYAHIHVYA